MVGGVLANLKLIGDDKKALFMLDKELAAKSNFNPTCYWLEFL